MRPTSSILLAITAFSLGALSIQCGGAGAGGSTARASSPSVGAPSVGATVAASATAPSPTATGAARITAAQRVKKLARDGFRRGAISADVYVSASKQELVAIRDSGVVGAQLVAAAEEYVATTEELLNLAKLRYPNAIDETALAQSEYAVAEARLWVEQAKR